MCVEEKRMNEITILMHSITLMFLTITILSNTLTLNKLRKEVFREND